MNKKSWLVAGGFVSFVLATLLAAAFLSYQFLGSGVSGDRTEVLFDVLPNQTMSTVSKNLYAASLIKNDWLFLQYAKIKGANAHLKRGEYALNQSMTPREIIAVITSGKSVARNFTVIEGANLFDIADLIVKQGIGTRDEFFQLVQDKNFIASLLVGTPETERPETLEGYLYPETYKITKFDTVKDTVTQMVKRFLTVWPKFEERAKALGWSRKQAVIFASIVEKETGFSGDRPLVASVFHNRLEKRMKLQTDPTVMYGVAWNAGAMPKNITKLDLLTPNRFNSYTNYGLPPTAISNPGRAALEASLNAPKTNYLYFVSRNDGTTAFSSTYAEHNSAVKSFQLNSKAREGKSWKDLNKNK